MKKFITGLVIFAALTTGIAHAKDIAVTNPSMSIDDNSITMTAMFAGDKVTDVKILFRGDSTGLTEKAVIQPYYDWYLNRETNITCIKDMYLDGWKLVQIIPYNATAAKQFYLVFVK